MIFQEILSNKSRGATIKMDFDDFKNKAINILNLNLDGYKIKRVKRRTDSLMKRYNINEYSTCLEKINNEPDFRVAYLNHLTINTSEFFRNPESFYYLKDNIFPELLKHKNKINIWSAPCSNGSEPYTLAILLQEAGISTRKFNILASDIDSSILEEARKGIYKKKSLKNIPVNLIEKYFNSVDENNNLYQIEPKIKKLISFEQKDLIKGNFKNNWDLILCRNFFIYLTKEIKKDLTNKFARALNKDGYLFLGNTEFIFNAVDYNLKKEKLSFYKKN